MAGFTSIKPPKPPGWVAARSNTGISKPPSSRNPFWSQASGKPWDPAAQVQGGPVRSTIPASQAPKSFPTLPAAAGQKPGTSATATAGDSGPVGPPLDATAVNNIATNQFKVNNQINAANQNIGNLRTGLQAALGQLAYQQPRDQLAQEQAANRQGALYSTAYNQRLGDLNQNYLTRQNTATSTEGQREGALAAQIQALLGGVPLYNQGQAAESVQRAIAAAAANPATGQPPAVSPPASGGGASGRPSPRPSLGSFSSTKPKLVKRGPSKTPIRDPFKNAGSFSSTVKRVR